VHSAQRAILAAQSSRASVKRENEREVREYMNGTWRRSLRERDARVCGARSACSVHIVGRGANNCGISEYINETGREHKV
jgi:hypothetical protein